MAVIKLNALRYDSNARFLMKGREYPFSKPVEFEETPSWRYAQAYAHLALHHPYGLIVYCRERGHRGGWLGLEAHNDPDKLRKSTQGTYHLGVTA